MLYWNRQIRLGYTILGIAQHQLAKSEITWAIPGITS